MKKIAIFIVTYNAVSTLTKVLDRIPENVRKKVSEIFVFDDSSKDDTYLVGVGYKTIHQLFQLNIYRNPKNLGYGGNQKKGYQYAIEKGYDIVALIHGDGQYAPECLNELLEPIEKNEADAVFGSRMMIKGAARKGGMPLYKFIGNKILTYFENKLLQMNLSEFHSGYRIYNTKALKEIPYQENSNDFHFDTEIIIQLHQNGFKIVEKPIPTYYGNEICYVNGLKYAFNVMKSTFQFVFHQAGIRYYRKYDYQQPYMAKLDKYSSHQKIAKKIQGCDLRVLDVGCGQGFIDNIIENPNTEIIGIDILEGTKRSSKISRFIKQNIESEFSLQGLDEFDYILLADILEHIRNPAEILNKCQSNLKNKGKLIIAVPNIANWTVRLNLLFGAFNYTPRGILDKSHIHFYTLKSISQLITSCGYHIKSIDATPIPLPTMFPFLAKNPIFRIIHFSGNQLSLFWKTLFAYQFIITAEKMQKT
jgi:glycosyltransferase involved in cell wall biosynthesis